MINKKILLVVLLIIIILAFAGYWFFIKPKIEPPAPVTQPTTDQQPGPIKPITQVLLSTDKEIYGPNEQIKAAVAIRNPFAYLKNWTVVYYFSSQDEFSFSAIGQVEELQLKPGQTEKLEFSSLVIPSLSPGSYKIKLEILENDQLISLKQKMIAITNTNQAITANLKVCPNISCQVEKAIYLQNNPIYIKLDSALTNLAIQGKIKYPDQDNWQELEFSNYLANIRANQLGPYNIMVDISKPGYQDLSFNKDFSVIESNPEINSSSQCQPNGFCSTEETAQNCPQDCS